MIVTPEFLDHWKTRMLVDELQGDEMAPLYVLRIWAHCQTKKTHRLGRVSAGALKSICRYAGAAEVLWLAMQNAGFILVKNDQVDVHQWSEYNAGLITSWSNGRKGGRPKKPTGNLRVTHGQPASNPLETDKRGLDEMRLEGIEIPQSAPAAPRVDADSIYKAYPRKTGPEAAKKVIAKVLQSIPGPDLLAKTQAYADATRTWTDHDKQYIPHPATWFNRGSYDDDPTTWQRKSTNPHHTPAPTAAEHLADKW